MQWHQERNLIRYSIFRSNYPTQTRVDTTKGLTRSGGRHFYHEVDYQAHECEAARVHVFATFPCGKVSEPLWIDGKWCRSFPTLELAQAWIAEQLGTSLHSFWLA